jgi:hypothetical protein
MIAAMSVFAVGAVCLGLAVLGAGLWRRHLAASLAVIALASVMAVSTYQSVEARARHLNGLPHASPPLDQAPPAYRTRGYQDLARAAIIRIPPGDTYAMVPVTPQGGSFWLRYVLAPRIRVDPWQARWVLVLGGSPQQAGVTGARSWRFGDNWLVRR